MRGMRLGLQNFAINLLGVAILLAIVGNIGTAAAQTYPSRPITMIVPFAAGGPTDAIGRIIAEHMRVSLGQPVIIENVVGASGNLGVGRAVRAAPDGYTVSLGTWPTHVLNGAVFALPYDLRKDFKPIAQLASNPELIIARKTLPANDLKELIAWLKANPDKALQGHVGTGSLGHIAGIFFQKQTGTRYQFVPYRGNPAQMQDLIAGQIDLMIDLAASALPQIRAGNVKAYAVADKIRMAVAPEIPTVDEAGVPGFYLAPWHALFVPKGTSPEVAGKLNRAAIGALADPMVRARLTELGQDIPPRERQTPEALAALHKAEIEKWWPIVREAGIKVD